MHIRSILCAIGIHDYHTVDLTDCFSTTYTDRNWGPIKHIVYYKRCSCCGKRITKSTYKNDVIYSGSQHAGIEYAKTAWEEYGTMYLGPSREYVKPTNKPNFIVYDGGKK